jgi:hypothetical protein
MSWKGVYLDNVGNIHFRQIHMLTTSVSPVDLSAVMVWDRQGRSLEVFCPWAPDNLFWKPQCCAHSSWVNTHIDENPIYS